MQTLPTYSDVVAAAERIKGYAHRTPVMRSRTIDAQLDASLYFKCENLQRIGAFKFRGAFNAIAALEPAQQRAGVIAFSSGNHAQGVALAASVLNVKATIVMPQDAPAAKLAATRGYGAQVVEYDRYTEDRAAIAMNLAQQHGYTLIPPYDHPDIIAGQGTAAMELIQETGPLDLLFVCLGGGGLLSGSALAARALAPECQIYGVEPQAGNDGQQSLRAGHIVRIDMPKTIADGAQTQFLGDYTFSIIQREVADILTVTDEELIRTMRFYAERMKMLVEPTGCLSLAGACSAKELVRGKRVGIIISGGNVDLAMFCSLLGSTQE
ncbi:threo-3-hydroxy-L-aspartate ammonia-lyase [Advenella mimigardefordensis]|uniref:Putative serine racemase n=1 Tax=Advenella mimigardefordensis (strain DSM 17166 / LMG 22922 / DPN7) TaxID=1247726 RepID=W0PBB9_ADVMD|nr:threo-3-hydroxy-L-aspartate ammonia-lyase [Advenella mimigardefordensis]AHG62705.1 putative serine racemase [Advenella mimigardefordensis DPN7]